MGEGRLRRETVEGFPLFVGRRGPSLQASAVPIAPTVMIAEKGADMILEDT